MAIFRKKCPKCGKNNSSQASCCIMCGTPLSGGTIICSVCRTVNQSDAKYCKKCGQLLDANATPNIFNHRWARSVNDFAVRVDVNDLPGLLQRGLLIEMGTNAMLIEGGVNRGIIGPGLYTLETFDKRIMDRITGDVGSRVSVLLVDIMPTDLEFPLSGIFTRDPIEIQAIVRLLAQVDEPAQFLTHMLRSQERFTRKALLQYLYPEVSQVMGSWIGQYTIKELAGDLSLKGKIELALEEALKATFNRNGIRFLNVRTLELDTEIEKVNGIKSRYILQATEAKAETQGKQRLLDVMQEFNLTQLAEETAKVENEERRAELYRRMRAVVKSGKMDELSSEAEFNVFLDNLDRQKLLREKERSKLLKTWQIDAEDKDRSRAHLLARLDLEEKYELRVSELQLSTDLSEKEHKAELRMARLRASKQFEIDSAEIDYELNYRRRIAEFERQQIKEQLILDDLKTKADLEAEASKADEEFRQMEKELEIGFKSLRGIKEVRLDDERAQWELEREKTQAVFQQRQQELEIILQHERIRMEIELNRLDKLGKLGTEALIAASPTIQGWILADLKQTELLKGKTEKQILDEAKIYSQDIQQSVAEKFKTIAEGKASEVEREMYENLLAEKEARNRTADDIWDKTSFYGKEDTE